MERSPLYMIRDRAVASGRAVFSVQELANLIGRRRSVATVYLSRLVKNKMAKKLKKGKISFTDDDFIIATQLVEPSYISLNSALLYHGIIKQIPESVECVTTKNSINYKDLGIRYHKIPKGLFFGYMRERKGSSYILVALAEKALLDGLYLNIYSEEEFIEHLQYMELINVERLVLLHKFKGRGIRKLNAVVSSSIKKAYSR